jgi:hypothetical protein
MRFFICMLGFFACLSCCSQKLDNSALQSRQKAEFLTDQYLKNRVKECNYVLFSAADTDYIILVENKDSSYTEYFMRISNEIKAGTIKDTTIATSKLMRKIFDYKLYKEDFVTFNSDFFKKGYENSSGNITYFVFKNKNGKRYGEARLSVFVNPNPIDAEVYTYFVERLFYYSKF